MSVAGSGRTDPTQTTVLRRRYAERLRGRWQAVEAEIRAGVGDRDVFSVGSEVWALAVGDPEEPEAVPSSLPGTAVEKVRAFAGWLTEQLRKGVQQVIGEDRNPFIRRAYRGGVENAAEALPDGGTIEAEGATGERVPRGGRGGTGGGVLGRLFGGAGGPGPGPDDDSQDLGREHRSKLSRLYEKASDKLNQIVTDTVAEVRDVLRSALGVEGEADDVTPDDLAERIVERLEKTGEYRSTLLAETGVIDANAEGVLNELERVAGPKAEVRIRGEWVDSDDEHVCPVCESIDGGVFTVRQIREETFSYIAELDPNADESDSHLTGQYPLHPPAHPRCRCALEIVFRSVNLM